MELASIFANVATAIGAFLLAWQVWVARDALRAQTRANELQVYTDMNMKFLDIMSDFKEHINDPTVAGADLEPQERRAIDRWFYLANMEYILQKEGTISPSLANQWIRGMKSAASRPVFVERWDSRASKFTLDEDFRKFFEEARKGSGGA